MVVENHEFAESKRVSEENGVNPPPVDSDGFMTIPDNVDDSGLPFNF